MQEKIGALVGGKAAREAERQHIFFKDAAGIRRSATFCGELTRVALAHLTDQRFSSCCTHLPQLFIGELADVIFDRTIPTPAFLATSRGPESICSF